VANSHKLTPKNITQKQIDALVRIVHSLNPMICNHGLNPKVGVALVSGKEFKSMMRAEKAFSKLSD
jgi:hypothetical protein